MTQNKEKIITLIKSLGLKATSQRIEILSLLEETHRPITIKELREKLGPSMDQVTIYRILDAFKKGNIVNQIDFQKGYAYYELRDADHDHHHIICTVCGRVSDFTGCDFKHLAKEALAQNKDFKEITNHSLEFFGVCNLCVDKAQ